MKDSDKKSSITILDEKQKSIINGSGYICTCYSSANFAGDGMQVIAGNDEALSCRNTCCSDHYEYGSWKHQRWVGDNYWYMRGKCADGSIERDDADL